MRKAAYDAGMISGENSSKLVLCLEPEAACMACEDERLADPSAVGNQILKTNDTFMVLDCGGGTVDITMHRVEGTKPLQLSEIREPSGGPWGSTYVDAAYERFVQTLIGDAAWKRFKPSSAWGMSALTPSLQVCGRFHDTCYSFCRPMRCVALVFAFFALIASCSIRLFTFIPLLVSRMVAEYETL